MESLKKYTISILVLIILASVLFRKYQLELVEVNEIKIDYATVEGKISKFKRTISGKLSPTKYYYKINNKRYEEAFVNQEPCGTLSDYQKDLLRQSTFPVVYSRKNPRLSRILIRPKDFQQFDLAFPDSLHTIYTKYFKECENDIIRFEWH